MFGPVVASQLLDAVKKRSKEEEAKQRIASF